MSRAISPSVASFFHEALAEAMTDRRVRASDAATGYLVDEWVNGQWIQIGSFASSSTSDAATAMPAGTVSIRLRRDVTGFSRLRSCAPGHPRATAAFRSGSTAR